MARSVGVRSQIGVAEEAWISVSSLHRKNPTASDFSIDEIMEEVRALRIGGEVRPGVYVHVIQHCVANRPAKPAKHRMLFETAEGRRRLFRIGDAAHPDRLNGKTTPTREGLPSGYEDMLDWYEKWSREKRKVETEGEDPLLALRGSGKHIWADEHADDYVRRLREGWS
jgi:hypothetical protein